MLSRSIKKTIAFYISNCAIELFVEQSWYKDSETYSITCTKQMINDKL